MTAFLCIQISSHSQQDEPSLTALARNPYTFVRNPRGIVSGGLCCNCVRFSG
jgi:hypothetical protein